MVLASPTPDPAATLAQVREALRTAPGSRVHTDSKSRSRSGVSCCPGSSQAESAAGWFVLSHTMLHSRRIRSEEHTSELQSLMRISSAVFCLKKKNKERS